MVIESDRKNQCHDEEQNQDVLVVRADYQQEKEANEQNNELSSDDVCENCAHKEPVFALEKRHTARTVVPDVKWLIHNARLATRRTTKSQRAPEDPLDLFHIYLQGINILREVGPTQKSKSYI